MPPLVLIAKVRPLSPLKHVRQDRFETQKFRCFRATSMLLRLFFHPPSIPCHPAKQRLGLPLYKWVAWSQGNARAQEMSFCYVQGCPSRIGRSMEAKVLPAQDIHANDFAQHRSLGHRNNTQWDSEHCAGTRRKGEDDMVRFLLCTVLEGCEDPKNVFVGSRIHTQVSHMLLQSTLISIFNFFCARNTRCPASLALCHLHSTIYLKKSHVLWIVN